MMSFCLNSFMSYQLHREKNPDSLIEMQACSVVPWTKFSYNPSLSPAMHELTCLVVLLFGNSHTFWMQHCLSGHNASSALASADGKNASFMVIRVHIALLLIEKVISQQRKSSNVYVHEIKWFHYTPHHSEVLAWRRDRVGSLRTQL